MCVFVHLLFLQPFRSDADAAVAAFAEKVLEVYEFESQNIVLALHNNGPGYSASSYLPGGEFASAAQSVSIGTLFTREKGKVFNVVFLIDRLFAKARDFFYVVPGNQTTPIYWCLAKSNLNAVLQVATSPPDDGSLSVFAALRGKQYVNTENAAEAGGSGDQVIAQLLNLRALVELIKQHSSRK